MSGKVKMWQVAAGLFMICGIVYFGQSLLVRLEALDQLPNIIYRRLQGEECATPCPVVGLQTIQQYRDYISTVETTCTSLRQFGGHPPAPDHGKKYMCMDERFNIKPGQCVVISFGVNHEWSFEDDVDKFGCKVYAFDPTMGKRDHNRSSRIQFFAVGIANYKGMKMLGGRKTLFKVDRFENMVNQLGLAGQEIDCVKIDVELSELGFLQDMVFNSPHVLRKIKQIAMEIHHGTGRSEGPNSFFQVYWPYFMLLRCQGFRIVTTRSGNGGGTQEIVWVREVQW